MNEMNINKFNKIELQYILPMTCFLCLQVMAPERPGLEDERCGGSVLLHTNGVTVPIVRQPLTLASDLLKVCTLVHTSFSVFDSV
jgi:hypothetical protein